MKVVFIRCFSIRISLQYKCCKLFNERLIKEEWLLSFSSKPGTLFEAALDAILSNFLLIVLFLLSWSFNLRFVLFSLRSNHMSRRSYWHFKFGNVLFTTLFVDVFHFDITLAFHQCVSILYVLLDYLLVDLELRRWFLCWFAEFRRTTFRSSFGSFRQL